MKGFDLKSFAGDTPPQFVKEGPQPTKVLLCCYNDTICTFVSGNLIVASTQCPPGKST